MVEETSKKRTRRTQKFMRAVTGATLADIMAKRNQKPEVRKAQRFVSSFSDAAQKGCVMCGMSLSIGLVSVGNVFFKERMTDRVYRL